MKTALLVVPMVLFAPVLTGADKVSSSDARKYGKQLELLIQGKRAFALKEYIKEVAALDDPRVVVYIPAAAAALPSAENHVAAVEAIAGLKNDASVQALASLLEKAKGDFRQSIVILEGFGGRADRASLDGILQQLQSKISHVQAAAIRACRARKSREVLEPLVNVVEEHWKKRDRSLIEARLALLALTGQDLDSPEDWKKYVSTLSGDFDPASVGKETGATAVTVKKTSDSVEFFGGEIFSQNLLFVIDVSGSMVMYDEDPEYKGTDLEKDRERLRRAREQLTQALKKLPRAARFNIITFSDKVLPWQKQTQLASPASVASALKFVNDFSARGATHTDEAVETAFADLGVDTIVLLSDGAPMKARETQAGPLIQKILEKVKDMNASRRVRIDTYGFEGAGQWPEKVPWAAGGRLPPAPSPEETKQFVEFLKKLAEENGGTYRAIR